MNCTRVLHILNPHPGDQSPIMPVDMAVRICLAGSPPLCSFLSNYDNRCSSSSAAMLQHCEPLRPCLSSNFTVATTTSLSAATETNSSSGRMRRKKRVVFADSRGFALTAVHVFNKAKDNLLAELEFHLTEIEGAAAALHLGGNKDVADCASGLLLDFTQPAADYLDLRNRLKAQQDIQCQYLNNIYGCPDTDTFSFSVLVPELFEPSNSVEFCIQYRTEDQTFWDNNNGNNYRLVVAESNSSPTRSTESPAGLEIQRDCVGEKREEMEFDPFGSPRTSAGIFPEWQSSGHVETCAPYW
ncbi:protein phosphatase 1 regulatory subunit 3C-B-like isoform X3 [Trachinotus anak]|uniref:protein phosphatase 1 regulatory subunit 3C-B-like isoform X3 n=1 Tax=Trachinotus anak TaxID=443729 RepID=UPI0039F211E2